MAVVLFSLLNYESKNVEADNEPLSDKFLELDDKLQLIEEQLTGLKQNSNTHESFKSSENQANAEYLALANTIEQLKNEISLIKGKVESANHKNDVLDSKSSFSEQEQIASERYAKRLELFDATLTQQPVDQNWTVEAEDQIKNSLEKLSETVAIDDLQCATTLCRLSIVQTSDMETSKLVGNLSRNIDWPGEMSLRFDPNTGQGSIYLARVGESLPHLSEH